MTIRSYQDLDVWKKSREIVKDVYSLSEDFPKNEMYGLANQMRRAAVSVPSNIAEGKCRSSRKEYIYHLKVASGSLAELETQCFIACDLRYIDEKTLAAILEKSAEVGRMLNGLLRSLEQSPSGLKPETRNLEPAL